MKLKARKLTNEDYDILVEWWKSWPNWEPLSKDLLPENGTGGIMIERESKPLIAGFLYATNSNICWMEWIVSDPEQKNKSEAISLLISSLEKWGKDAGFKVVLSIGRSKNLINEHKKLGYTVDSNSSYEIIKNI